MTVTARNRTARTGDHDGHLGAGGHGPRQQDRSQPADAPTTVWWWVRTIVSWLVLLLMVAILALMVVIPRLTGSQAYTVLTGSMEPTMPPGTLIVVKPTPNDELETGDVITFQPVSGDPAVVTHRIEGIYYTGDGQRRIYTRGDANDVADSWALVPEQIRGKVIYSVPYLGRVNSVINGQSRSILVTVVAAGLGVYAVVMVISGLRDKRGGRHRATDDPSIEAHGADAAVTDHGPSGPEPTTTEN